MSRPAVNIPALCLLLLPLAAFISSCENDLKKVRELSANEVDTVAQRSTGLDLIMSDSTKVEIHLTAPLMIEYQIKKPYKIMPKGVKIDYYDRATGQFAGDIIADTGINREQEKLIEFHGNVVATNAKGETFKSNELFWDQVTKRVYSNKPVQATLSGGNVMNGDTFESDDKLLNPSFKSSTGIFHVDEKATQ
ncbi:LPS export ABC transporter periplasmic protein LptC [Mucilaginibacter sp. SMC90]|uniref:LPS export ABC transporter periplasmic protein LptC n=1 Tax=Mucilaginibacter sp. SMC90 TaxID=2929803 RepID=UPI001FB24657|nr:LPS export ABC transporter periplasmic protein LptC [Mucilaginibacter sp. SMC90]UOE48598.1 LPS export ABC transporter periplasmic protein LptC [Mucilaginibacter sp. SMC90]